MRKSVHQWVLLTAIPLAAFTVLAFAPVARPYFVARFRGVGADLHGAWLPRARLSGARLGGARLSDANLAGADLRAADLMDADLSGANLAGADLRQSDLLNATLRGADLQDADLREAGLQGADLLHADLRGADLRDIRIESTFYERVNVEYAVYDDATRWPEGFDPQAYGAVHERDSQRIPPGDLAALPRKFPAGEKIFDVLPGK